MMDETALRTTGFTRSRVTFKDPSPRSDATISPRKPQQHYVEDTMRSTWGSDFATTIGSEVFLYFRFI